MRPSLHEQEQIPHFVRNDKARVRNDKARVRNDKALDRSVRSTPGDEAKGFNYPVTKLHNYQISLDGLAAEEVDQLNDQDYYDH